jgi:gentisate 1,2-dioxygenase
VTQIIGTMEPTVNLTAAMAKQQLAPLWSLYKTLNTREPQFYEPMIWPWSAMEKIVDRAAREVSMDEAERRALLFCHPAFPGTVFTTPTLSGALQILEPGETAPPHRHTLAALRLVMLGEGAETVTDGKACPMEPGDLILTPAWSWHEHRHNGKGRVVWFDGLDYPLARQLGTVFFEMGPGPIPARDIADYADDALREAGVLPDADSYPLPYSPLYRYAWKRVVKAIEAMPSAADGSKRIRYTNPIDGGPIMPTIDCYALRPGASFTASSRSTATAMVVVIEGEGESRIGDKTFQWKAHDVFTLPRWQWTEHRATEGPATLFLMTDRELMSRIGHLREELRTN